MPKHPACGGEKEKRNMQKWNHKLTHPSPTDTVFTSQSPSSKPTSSESPASYAYSATYLEGACVVRKGKVKKRSEKEMQLPNHIPWASGVFECAESKRTLYCSACRPQLRHHSSQRRPLRSSPICSSGCQPKHHCPPIFFPPSPSPPAQHNWPDNRDIVLNVYRDN